MYVAIWLGLLGLNCSATARAMMITECQFHWWRKPPVSLVEETASFTGGGNRQFHWWRKPPVSLVEETGVPGGMVFLCHQINEKKV